jgi:hypothetical protein
MWLLPASMALRATVPSSLQLKNAPLPPAPASSVDALQNKISPAQAEPATISR